MPGGQIPIIMGRADETGQAREHKSKLAIAPGDQLQNGVMYIEWEQLDIVVWCPACYSGPRRGQRSN